LTSDCDGLSFRWMSCKEKFFSSTDYNLWMAKQYSNFIFNAYTLNTTKFLSSVHSAIHVLTPFAGETSWTLFTKAKRLLTLKILTIVAYQCLKLAGIYRYTTMELLFVSDFHTATYQYILHPFFFFRFLSVILVLLLRIPALLYFNFEHWLILKTTQKNTERIRAPNGIRTRSHNDTQLMTLYPFEQLESGISSKQRTPYRGDRRHLTSNHHHWLDSPTWALDFFRSFCQLKYPAIASSDFVTRDFSRVGLSAPRPTPSYPGGPMFSVRVLSLADYSQF
jgi:hypothetical protein